MEMMEEAGGRRLLGRGSWNIICEESKIDAMVKGESLPLSLSRSSTCCSIEDRSCSSSREQETKFEIWAKWRYFQNPNA